MGLALAGAFASGCASSQAGERTIAHASLDATVARYEGTPYRYGGTTSRGFDCSGFLQVLFAEAYGLSLPRTTRSQARAGREVERRDLQRGDLVFFRIDSKGTRHAGVYLGEDRFAHASSSRGVMISELSMSYWQQRFWTARRVLAHPDRLTGPTPARADPAPAPPRGRGGW